MPSGHDRGHAVLSQKPDGTTVVAVCTSIKNGKPQDIYARFSGVEDVRIDPGVRLARGGSLRYTHEIVEVYAESEKVVRVKAVASGQGLSLD